MKECFIITPIGESSSETRRETDGLVKSVLEPVLGKYDFDPIPAHKISETGSITRQIIKRILEAELVVANLTGLNPNVMYEVGIRHCARKPLIVIAREGTVLPFDLSDERTIFYKNDMSGSEELKDRLSEIIPAAIEDKQPDNPVYRIVDIDLIQLPEGAPEISVLTSQRFSMIEDQLEKIQSAIRNISVGKDLEVKWERIGKTPVIYKEGGFSCYIEQQEHLDMFKDLCEKESIKYEVKTVYKEVEKFSAYPLTKKHWAELENIVKETGVKRVS